MSPTDFDQLASKFEALQRSNEELKQFAYVAAHDLREPLRSISGFIQLLERREGPTMSPDGREFMQMAVKGVRQMEETLSGLLAYSLIDGTEPEGKTFEMDELIGEVCLNLNSKITASGSSIVHGHLPVVKGDRSQIKRVFQNLIENALKFRSEANPEIRIETRPAEDGYFEFTVTDNGIGIEPAYKDRVFKIFERLHTREKYEGSGIGLAICKRIVERHGGAISIDPDYEGGVRLRFFLPSAESGPIRVHQVLTKPIEVLPEAKVAESVGPIRFVEPLQVPSGPEPSIVEEDLAPPELEPCAATFLRARSQKRAIVRRLKAASRQKTKSMRRRRKRWKWQFEP